MVQLAAIAVKAGITKRQWDSTMALHPTAAEEIVLMRERVQPPVGAG
jgi:glutathione reductase (NADPH)